MSDLLAFVPRPRTKLTPTVEMKETVSALVNDIQVIARYDRSIVLMIMARFAREQRDRLQQQERHGHLSPR